ncbi:hypothetical protein C8F01DRAFT_1239353 [Mycena amicta]|nr:hypothetical protein C8F01DRAFT_1239353 [Mycena amicta]
MSMPVPAALRLDRLQVLPISTRIIILPACKSNASKETIDRAVEKILKEGKDALSAVNLNRYLPFFFAVLDPSRIPSAAAMETLSSATQTAVYSGAVALDLILLIKELPPAIALHCWPRISAWLGFIHLHDTQVSTQIESPRPYIPGRLYTNLLLYMVALTARHPEANKIFHSTPGFATFVMKIWVHFRDAGQLRMRDQLTLFTGLLSRTNFGRDTESRPRKQLLEEALDGAGGTYGDMALLIVDFLDAVLATTQELEETRSGRTTADFVRVILMVTIDLDHSSLSPPTEEHPLHRYGGHLTSALREIDAVYRALLNITNYLSAFPAPPRPDGSGVGLCGSQLLKLIQEEVDIASAIRAGLVRTLANIYSGTGHDETFEMMLELVLTPVLTSTQLLPACSQAIEQLPVTQLDNNPQRVAFVEKTAERMGLLAQLDDSKDNESSSALATWRTKACDNVECVLLLAYMPNYGLAWRQRSSLADFMIPRIPFKQRCFLRQLIHADYLQNFDKICRLQAEFISVDSESDSTPATADPPLCITWFDYAYRTDVEITIHDVDSDLVSHLRSGAEAEWDHIFLRARRSRGTIAIHVLSLTQLSSEASRFVIIPLRISASAARKLGQLCERQCDSEAEFSLFSSMLEGADEGIFGIH